MDESKDNCKENYNFNYTNGMIAFNKKDFKLAFYYFRNDEKHIQRDHAGSISMLGLLYYKGYYVEKNIQQSLKYFYKGDRLHDEMSWYYLSLMYYYGDYLPKSNKLALKYMKQAYEYKYPKSFIEMAMYHKNNINSEEIDFDEELNYELFIKYLIEGTTYSCSNCYLQLAHIAYDTKIYDKALELYIKSSKLNNAIAYKCLGHMYFVGEGTKIDYNKSYSYYCYAKEYGCNDIDDCIENIENKYLNKILKQI